MRSAGSDDGTYGIARRATLSELRSLVSTTRSPERVADRKSCGQGTHRDFARTCQWRDRDRVRNACAYPGEGANPRTRARRYRRAAPLRRFRSRKAESAGAACESAHDDGDAYSEKLGDEPVREPRRIVSRRAPAGAHADND